MKRSIALFIIGCVAAVGCGDDKKDAAQSKADAIMQGIDAAKDAAA